MRRLNDRGEGLSQRYLRVEAAVIGSFADGVEAKVLVDNVASSVPVAAREGSVGARG